MYVSKPEKLYMCLMANIIHRLHPPSVSNTAVSYKLQCVEGNLVARGRVSKSVLSTDAFCWR